MCVIGECIRKKFKGCKEATQKAKEEARRKAEEKAAARKIDDAVWEKNIDEYRKMLIESGMNRALAVAHTSLMALRKPG